MTDKPQSFDRDELRPCAGCGRGVMHSGSPIFYEITMRSCIVDVDAVRQQHGLEVMLGPAAALARVLAPTTRVALRMPVSRHLLCTDCAMAQIVPVVLISGEDDKT